MVRLVPLAALLLAAVPVTAQSAPAVSSPPLHRGQVLRDATGARLGTIDSVATDGSIGLVVDGRYVRLPASVVTNVDGKAQTSLSKRDTKKLR